MGRLSYTEIGRCKITKTRDAVISRCSNGSYTLAQQATFDEDGHSTSMFFRGALHIDSEGELKGLRDLIDDVLARIAEKRAMEEDEAWDLIEEEERNGGVLE